MHLALGLFTAEFTFLFDISIKMSVVCAQTVFTEYSVSYVKILDSYITDSGIGDSFPLLCPLKFLFLSCFILGAGVIGQCHHTKQD